MALISLLEQSNSTLILFVCVNYLFTFWVSI